MTSGAQGSVSPSGFPINRPGSGGMMPGTPGIRKMPGMPRMDNDNWEVPKSRSMPRGNGSTVQPAGRIQPPLIGKSPASNQQLLPQVGGAFTSGKTSPVLQASAARLDPDELKRKTTSLLDEYFSVRLLDEALQCIEELKSPACHPKIVKEAISLGLEKSPPCVEPVAKLLEYLFASKTFTAKDYWYWVLPLCSTVG
ncbi:Eukaryotic translation initiation factor isoform 4G-1 [Forsythia ovata]|uniref:Eukaryotic translation initiation factor isoform 4G-1 n=1 Tax=Forsythia ovata TaxID=205694 RepID=A0ABD1SRU4_9LAMI